MFLHSTIRSNFCRLSIVRKYASRHIHFRLFSLGNMNFGRNGKMGSTPGGSSTSSRLHSDSKQVSGGGQSHNAIYSNWDKSAHNRSLMQNKHQFASASLPDCEYDDEYPPLSAVFASSSKNEELNKRRMKIDLGPEQTTENIASTQLEDSSISINFSQRDVSSPSIPFWNNGKRPAHVKASPSKHSYSNHEAGAKQRDSSEASLNFQPFDICLPRRRNFRTEKKNEYKQAVDWTREGVLRPGMVLLKHYLTIREQIIIVRTCQELGKGPGGFYQPGYSDGAKLRLRLMCLGLDWDPQSRKYGKMRQFDGCEPPVIPSEFEQLVQRSISEAHALIKMDSEVSNMEDVLPALSPDICIVNFYTISGRLGLHQDRDESRKSLKKGLPVVSFSVGDSADFLFGDERDVDKAEKVLLESGDVLIFGGQSRHVFHGVSSINSNSSPGALLEKTMLRAGRLNLTFRQY